MTTQEEQVMPALYHHAVRVYAAMSEKATMVHADGDSSTVMLVFEGFLTHLFEQLNLSVPYYTTVRQALLRMGCIRQLKRGGGNSPSQWELICEPTREAFGETGARKPRRTRVDVLEHQVLDLQRELLRLRQDRAS